MGSRIFYYCFLKPVSMLPLSVLYVFSDFFSFMLNHVFTYRKKLILKNLRNSFPQKSEEELRAIAKKYYSHLCDLLVETIRGFSMPREEARRRMKSRDRQVLDKYAEQGKDCMVVCGHFGNWELLVIAADSVMSGVLVGIYKKINDRFFEKKMKQSRGRNGAFLMSTEEFKNQSKFLGEMDKPYVLALVMDQSPFRARQGYWMEFMNQDTVVLFGPERYAKKYNLPVVYGKISKLRRGHYEVSYEDLVPEPRNTAYGEITEKMTRRLELDVKAEPEYWLWSHRRWKHKRPLESELEQFQKN